MCNVSGCSGCAARIWRYSNSASRSAPASCFALARPRIAWISTEFISQFDVRRRLDRQTVSASRLGLEDFGFSGFAGMHLVAGHPRVRAAAGQKFLVRAVLDDPAFFHHVDAVAV